MIVLVMGVSGSGKTTIGQKLAARLGYQFADADNWHSKENVAKMRSGIPLTDADRKQWLSDLHQSMQQWVQQKIDTVLACSALKRSYRELLTADIENDVRLVYLSGSEELIKERMQLRTGHYMPASLLHSQFETVEPPLPGEAIVGDITKPPDELVEQISSAL